MKTIILNRIVCPSIHNGIPCHKRLAVSSKIPLKYYTKDKQDIIEGLLYCPHCKREYPILCGLLILLPDVQAYLCRNYGIILKLTAEENQPLEPNMMEYLHLIGAHIPPRNKAYESHEDGDSAYSISMQLNAHYDNVLNSLPQNNQSTKLLSRLYSQDLYSKIIEMLNPYLKKVIYALDIGCNVGRMTHELARNRCDFVFGIDLSFMASYIGRRILLGKSYPLTNYELFHDQVMREKRPLKVPLVKNAEIIISSGLSLPFKDNYFDLVNSTNVFDIIPNSTRFILEQVRVLNTIGLLVFASPYYWQTFESNTNKPNRLKKRDSAQKTRDMLLPFINIVYEKEYIPWIIREYDRKFTIFFSHCLIGYKEKDSKISYYNKIGYHTSGK